MTPEHVSRAAAILKEYAVSIYEGNTITNDRGVAWSTDVYAQESKREYEEICQLVNEMKDMVRRYNIKAKKG